MLFIGGAGCRHCRLDENCLNNPDGPRMDATETLLRKYCKSLLLGHATGIQGLRFGLRGLGLLGLGFSLLPKSIVLKAVLRCPTISSYIRGTSALRNTHEGLRECASVLPCDGFRSLRFDWVLLITSLYQPKTCSKDPPPKP